MSIVKRYKGQHQSTPISEEESKRSLLEAVCKLAYAAGATTHTVKTIGVNLFDNHIKGQETWPRERYGAYAPGNYWCTCVVCNGTFDGDKRAAMCYPCAVKHENDKITNNLGGGI